MLQVKALREMIEGLPETTLVLAECDVPCGPGRCDIESVTVRSTLNGFLLVLEVDPG